MGSWIDRTQPNWPTSCASTRKPDWTFALDERRKIGWYVAAAARRSTASRSLRTARTNCRHRRLPQPSDAVAVPDEAAVARAREDARS